MNEVTDANKESPEAVSSSRLNSDFSDLLTKLRRIKPKLLVVFGSYLLDPKTARDLDILVISERFQNVYYQRRRSLLPDKHCGKRIDSYCFTKKEFKLIFDRNHPLMRAIADNHINLVGMFHEYL